MDQAQLELQLKVWKDLAISKQVLMRTATEALKLDPNCTQEELKVALDAVIKRLGSADADIAAAREQARQSVATVERKLQIATQAHNAAEAAKAALLTNQENVSAGMVAERAATAKEIKALKDRLTEREKAIKAINTALADTPENVIKKMNLLKKQRQEEADSRRQVENNFNTLRAEKQKQDQTLKTTNENTTKLIAKYKDLHEATAKLHEQLKPLVADAKDLPELVELDAKLIEAIEDPEAAKKAEASGKRREEKGGLRKAS